MCVPGVNHSGVFHSCILLFFRRLGKGKRFHNGPTEPSYSLPHVPNSGRTMCAIPSNCERPGERMGMEIKTRVVANCDYKVRQITKYRSASAGDTLPLKGKDKGINPVLSYVAGNEKRKRLPFFRL